ncbi:hypothetical protein LWI29_005560 [Acer saccharum]|uniref:Protein kinase domain-containing protein n=3 Tax=Acer saccharum TaxID=4024 RepID=A0AA39SR16_ACESA|nr:hypothetical protein LWI29_005560 [Acer saccharum]
MTNNFQRIIGKGGFGTVYYGCLDDSTQVAVKMLSPSSIQGYKQFQAEVELLMRVHHKNLTSLVGYCDDGTNMGLIYEFMANGNLETHLLDKTVADSLSWEKRLQIATEAALGLEYLHSGCKPPIVHRDVKSTNILLNEKFQAKLADFGLSRIFPIESGTHMTSIAGTPGYLDPEYYISGRLTEKSDVYSFGVVLLELITSKTVIEKSHERIHISQWVSFMLAKGDIKNVVDPRLHGDFDINSVWKAIEIAMACVSPNSAKRPTMAQVVMELNECLAIQTDRGEVDDETNLKDSVELVNLNLHSELFPLARLKDDACDRIWSPYRQSNWLILSSLINFNTLGSTYQPPSTVLQTGAMPGNDSDSLVIVWVPNDPTAEYYFYLYFAELDQSQQNKDDRGVDVYLNGVFRGGPFKPPYNTSLTVHTGESDHGQRLEFSFNKSKKSLLPPILNGIELHQLKPFHQLLTNQQDTGNKATQSNGRSGSFELKNQRFSYSDVVRMTNNFQTIIGKGGFGTVYYGCLDDTQVAVKMLSPSSIQGYKEFQAEVELLMRVHHKNLASLVGYCDDGTNMGLIYEFMANGNLETHLLDKKVADILNWEKRLQIATEAALGLEYLHSGCKPPIVHRDVKSTNILLNEKFQAKLADFGLSRIFPTESGTHMLASIAGTPGHLDPEYYISSRLTEKSDVYSFGVVLLELITSKTVIEKSHARTHISQWVSFMLAKADIKNVVDPRLHGDFNINSVWKVVEIAMACVSPNSAKRPTMTQVVMELNECLAIETGCREVDDETDLKDSVELVNFNMHSEISPLARQYFF